MARFAWGAKRHIKGEHRLLNLHQLSSRRFLRVLGSLIALGALTLCGQGVSREYQLKAVFLYRFAQFVDWPPTAFPTRDSPIVIGVLGRDPFGELLEAAVRNERVGDRRLTVHHYQRVQDIKQDQILFISASEDGRLEKIFTDLKGRSILTVGETENFALRGGMVQFFTQQNRIRFRINLKAARAAHLQLSSKLLELAEVMNAQQE
ncbi:MAG TPA: YfiR family protein [Candidatus Sulfotelmatobacter sp.]|nr:YfiR family protein [Candidatus Sulfotelmatobacter sp.]